MSPAILIVCSVVCLLFSTLTVNGVARVNPTQAPPSSVSGDDGQTKQQARCVDIPPDLSACRSLGYRQMRLPSLVNDTANVTIPLLDGCDDDALVILCSLVAPVCIDEPIWPCASLCRNATSSCRHVAALVDCDKLPPDDHLCIGPNSVGRTAFDWRNSILRDRLQRRRRQRLGRRAGNGARRRRRLEARRDFSRTNPQSPSRKHRKRKISDRAADDDARNMTAMTSCSVCADQMSLSQLTDTLCGADFVAKVRPSRYIRAGDSLKLLASRSTKFYKSPPASSSPRRRAVFFLHGTSAAQCSCLLAPGADSSRQRPTSDASLLVAGRLDDVNSGRRRARLVVTAALPFSDRQLVRRAVRIIRNSDACQRRAARSERHSSRRDGRQRRRRRRRPTSRTTTAADDENNEELVAARLVGRKRGRLQERADGTKRSRRRKSQRNGRGRRQLE